MKARKEVLGKFKPVTNQEVKRIIDELKTPQKISMTPAPRCKCKIENTEPHHGLNVNHELYINYCPTHAQAFEMEAALKRIAIYGVWNEEITIESIDIMRNVAREALRWAKETP